MVTCHKMWAHTKTKTSTRRVTLTQQSTRSNELTSATRDGMP
jgi:hypothetical protein